MENPAVRTEGYFLNTPIPGIYCDAPQCVGMCVNKLAQKVFNQSTSFLVGQPSLWLMEEMIIFWEIPPRVKGGPKFDEMGHFQVLITGKWQEIDMWLLLDTNKKSYIGSSTAPLDLTLKSQILGQSDFEDISHKAVKLCIMLILNTNRKPYLGSVVKSNCSIRSNSRSLRFWSLIHGSHKEPS